MSKFTLRLVFAWMLASLATMSFGAPQGAQKAPDQPPPRGQFRPGEMMSGTIASVGVDRIEIKSEDGASHIVLVSDQTRYRQGEQEIQLEDLKPGDRVFARGQTDANKQFTATTVRRVTEEEMQRSQAGREGGPPGGFQGERLGGEILSIEGNQLKVRTRMRGEVIVVVNDKTTFMKEGQAITLKDLKVGDRIFAAGKEADGKFVAERVMTGQFGRRQ